jgi:hypothetical protein
MNNLQCRKETQFRNVATPVYILPNLPGSNCIEADWFDGIQILWRYLLREHVDLSGSLEYERIESEDEARGFSVSLTTCQEEAMWLDFAMIENREDVDESFLDSEAIDAVAEFGW